MYFWVTKKDYALDYEFLNFEGGTLKIFSNKLNRILITDQVVKIFIWRKKNNVY